MSPNCLERLRRRMYAARDADLKAELRRQYEKAKQAADQEQAEAEHQKKVAAFVNGGNSK